MDRTVTLEDVAKAAGVGKGTVDRVLHNRGRVAEKTRQRVLACVEEMKYRPNVAARMLAQKRSYRIAVCFHELEHEFWDQVREGVDRAAEEFEPMGVQVEPFILPQIDVDSELAVIRHVVEEKYDGLAIVPYCAKEVSDALNDAIARGVQVTTFNNHEEDVHACYIGLDGLQSGRTAGRLMSMIAAPRSRYIIISAHGSRMRNIDQRAIGFQEVLGVQRPDMVCLGSFVFEEDFDKVYRFVLEEVPKLGINAIYATNGCVAVVGKAVAENGIGAGIRIVGHDLTPSIVRYLHSGDIDVTISQEPENQGYLSVQKICRKLLAGEEMEDYHTRIGIVVSENVAFS